MLEKKIGIIVHIFRFTQAKTCIKMQKSASYQEFPNVQGH
jgi:hypothetical protein